MTPPPRSHSTTHHGPGAGIARAVLWAVLVTGVIAWPVIRDPSRMVFGTEIVGRHHDPYTVMWQFETGPPQPPYRQPLVDDAGHALARGIGPVAAFNLLVLISFPLSVASAYGLARYLHLSHAAALVAAFAYAFAPLRLAHAAYHPHIAQTQWLALYLLALWAGIDRPTVARAALLAASMAGLALSNLYGAFIAAVVTPVALAAYWALSPRVPAHLGRTRSLLLPTVALLLTAGVALTAVALTAPAVLFNPSRFAADASDLARDGARWWAYVVPPVDHPLFGSLAHRLWAQTPLRDTVLEQQVSVSWALLALAGVAIWRWAQRALIHGDVKTMTPTALRSVPVLICVAVWAVLCSVAPTEGRLTPAAWLYWLAPMFRAYARFGIVTHLAVALLAGVGLMCLLETRTGRARLLPVGPDARRWPVIGVSAALLVAAVDYAPIPWRARDVLPTQAHRFLAEQPLPVRALDCVARSPAVAFVPWLMQRDLRFLSSSTPRCEDPELPAQLAALDYTHIIVRAPTDRGADPAGVDASFRTNGLTLVRSYEDADLFAVSADRAPIVVVDVAGFHESESESGRVWRWMGQQGTWSVRNTSGATVRVIPDIELVAFARPRQLELSVDGQSIDALAVAPHRRRYRLPALTLGPGDHTVSFKAREPATVADDVVRNGDHRALTIAMSSPRWGAAVAELQGQGFFEPESDGGRTWRWMGERSSWHVQHTGGADTLVVMDVELAAFPHPRRLVLSQDDRALASVSVDVTPRRYRLGPFVLSSGVHRIGFEALEPAVVADDVVRNGDRRALAIMMGESRWEIAPVPRSSALERAANP